MPDTEPTIVAKLIAVSRLHPHPHNLRRNLGDITGLAGSLRRSGQMSSMLVQPHPDLPEGHYQILAGERRWMAAKQAGTKRLLCLVRPPQTRLAATVIMLDENGRREPLNPMNYAHAFGLLRDGDGEEQGMSVSEMVAATGYSTSTISRYLRLLELDPASQERVRTGTVTVQRALAAISSTSARRRSRAAARPAGGTACEADYGFTRRHPLAGDARERCAAAGHTDRRKYGPACCDCWSTAIIAHDRRTTPRNGPGPDVTGGTAVARLELVPASAPIAVAT